MTEIRRGWADVQTCYNAEVVDVVGGEYVYWTIEIVDIRIGNIVAGDIV